MSCAPFRLSLSASRRPGAGARWRHGVGVIVLLVSMAGGALASQTGSSLQVSLLERFDVADRRGPVERTPNVREPDRVSVEQRCGSSLVYHVVVPRAARLVAKGVISSTLQTMSARLSVRATDTDGNQQTILARSIEGNESMMAIEEALEAPTSRMMRLEISIECEAGDAIGVQWEELHVKGVAPPVPEPASIARDRYNVLVILLDSLRADHVVKRHKGVHTTPRIDSLARKGVEFRAARSTASWTRPAVASLLTARQSLNHGIVSLESALPDALPYLPAILEEQGYETILITNTGQLSDRFGFRRGFKKVFDHFKLDVATGPRRYRDPVKNANEVWKKYIANAARAAREKPFFVYIHERDPHAPFAPPPPYDKAFTQGYEGEVDSSLMGIVTLRSSPDAASPALRDHLRGLYRGEVSYMDLYVGTLMKQLVRNGLTRRTLVVFVSDHGEEFWEHDSIGHGHTVYEELLKIPLIMHLPGVLPRGLATDVPMDLADVMPSILDLLGIAIPNEAQGESVLPYVFADAAAQREKDASRQAMYHREHFSLAQANSPPDSTIPRATGIAYQNWKLISVSGGPGAERFQLFDLEADPGETMDVANLHPVVVGTLVQMMRWMQTGDDAIHESRAHSIDTDSLDPDVERNLRALGYIE